MFTHKTSFANRIALFSIVFSVAVLPGCGDSSAPDLYPASGTVTFNGAPLADAQITFIPENGPVAMAISDLEGKFTLRTGKTPGAVAGMSKVSVVASAGGGDGPLSKPMTPEDMQAMQIAGTLEAAMNEQNKSLIPEKYGRADTSGLSFEVKKGEENNFAIDLK